MFMFAEKVFIHKETGSECTKVSQRFWHLIRKSWVTKLKQTRISSKTQLHYDAKQQNLSLDVQVASLAAWMFKGILIIVFDIKRNFWWHKMLSTFAYLPILVIGCFIYLYIINFIRNSYWFALFLSSLQL